MKDTLTAAELGRLFKTVFALGPSDRRLILLSDWPDEGETDTRVWSWRRQLAGDWAAKLASPDSGLGGIETHLLAYPSVGAANRDLPSTVRAIPPTLAGKNWSEVEERGKRAELTSFLDKNSAVIAITEHSATAPLKVLAKTLQFRGNTMPGFTPEMIPSLKLDYHQVQRRVATFTHLLEEWDELEVTFVTPQGRQQARFDLRFRPAHASSGFQTKPGEVGNLPSGEAYLAPYEGEKDGQPSRTHGLLPVQMGSEIVLFEIEGNRAVRVLSQGLKAQEQAKRLAEEPAYGNIAEVGLGVLGEFGIQAVGATLLDEKLGLHIAFGRSDHFGGITSPALFRDPKKVVHIDWVYVPSLQPQVQVAEATLVSGEKKKTLLREGRYCC